MFSVVRFSCSSSVRYTQNFVDASVKGPKQRFLLASAMHAGNPNVFVCHRTQNHVKDTVPYWLMNRCLGLSFYKKPGFESVIGTAAIYDNVSG